MGSRPWTGLLLAGRIEYVELTGLQVAEVGAARMLRLWMRGGFPRSFLEVRTILAETVQEWTAEWVEQGREQGQRALLCRLAAQKFDAAAAQRLASALEGVADPDRLAQVGDWIIECATAADLWPRFQDDSV